MHAAVLTRPQGRRGAVAWLAAAVMGVAALAAPPPLLAQGGLPDFSDLAEKVGPSVVNIRTLERGGGRGAMGQQREMDPQFEEFFRRFGIPIPPGGNRRGNPGGGGQDDEPQQRGIGSGFVLSADGYVMTNAHVVEGADEVIVTLTDKREFKAKIIGADKRTDVAVVKIEGSGLPAVKIGDVSRLKVGEWVMAIGSPFGLENTVTAGIVSAKQRDTGDFLPLLQTDVAINPGNSGGPLINLRGEVVGINSQIYSRSGGYMGIAFAIPIDEAMRVADQLRSSGRVIRGRIGVMVAPVTKDVAESAGLGKPLGALVQNVESGGPADKAGVEAGDIIVKADGKTVEKSGDLPRIIGATKPGAKTAIQVFRRGSYKDLSVTVVEFESEKPATKKAAASEPSAAPAKTALGLTVSDLSDAQKKELKVKGGVRVDAAEGAAAKAGLREGDIVLTLDNVEIADSKQFAAVAGKADKAKPINVMYRRGEWVSFLLIRPAAR
ncbi:periplasmic serine protease, Do/DeqQ family [Burkholderiales bacterium JOSHI_001]|nr:periplasmic serine protease, Do/DeqQ family [Burkholderiales bacterium JOSHI_001]